MNTGKKIFRLNALVLLTLFTLVAIWIKKVPGFLDDMEFWKQWATAIYKNGLSKVYYTDTNYLPFYHYILFTFGKIAGSTESIARNINYLRLFTMAFDCAGLWLVYKWIGYSREFVVFLLLNILNIAYSYNSLIWGQVDGIMTTLVFAALYFGYYRKYFISALFMVLALNMKLQAIIFLPLITLLFFQHRFSIKTTKAIVTGIAAAVIMQLIILLPFFANDKAVVLIGSVAFDSVDKYPRVSMNAMNFWHLAVRKDVFNINDANTFIPGLSYKQTGLILFALGYLLAVWPLIKGIVSSKGAENPVNKEKLWLAGALIASLFYYFNTQMHERYIHPAFIFITAYSFYRRDYILYVLFSVAYLLNLERVLKAMGLPNYGTFVFSAEFISCLFLVVILYLFYRLYRPHASKSEAPGLAGAS